MNDLQKKLGKRIQELRRLRGFSQEQFAEQIDIAVNTLSNIERGNSFMTAATMEKIILTLNTTPRELFSFNNENEMDDVYRYILLKIKYIQNDFYKLNIVKTFIDSVI